MPVVRRESAGLGRPLVHSGPGFLKYKGEGAGSTSFTRGWGRRAMGSR